MDMNLLYRSLDQKHIALVKLLCDSVVIDNVEWFDSTGQYLLDTRTYLVSRGLLVLHPTNCALWRLKELPNEPNAEGFVHPDRLRRPWWRD